MPLLLVELVIALLGQAYLPLRTPDLSGRWFLVAPDRTAGAASAPATAGVGELLVTQDARSIVVEHATADGRYPKAATHRLSRSGTVGRAGAQSTTDVFWFGDQLIVSIAGEGPRGADGRQLVSDYGERWALESGGRLVINYSRTEAGTTERGTLVYKKR